LVYQFYCITTGRITTGRKLKKDREKERRNKESSKWGEKGEEK